MRVLIVGCGYIGLALGAKLKRAGHEVYGLRRSRAADTELRGAGIQPIHADITQSDSLPRLSEPFDWVIHCAAAGGGGAAAYRQVYVQGTRNLLSWLGVTPDSGVLERKRQALPPPKLIYTSSTSVYGQDDGSWVTEESLTEPKAETGRVLLEAEQTLLNAHRATGLPAIIIRLAGIYGPDRGYWFKQFRSGQATLDGGGRRFLNMIHRDDVAGAIVAALESGRPGEIYNVVDDEPVTQHDLFGWLAETLGEPMPPPAPPDEILRKRGATNKRISNRKLREELGYGLTFPTFRDGFGSVSGALP